MTRALTILRKEFTDTIRDKRTILMMVVIPLLVIPALIGIVAKVAQSQAQKAAAEESRIAFIGGENAPALFERVANDSMFSIRQDVALDDVETLIRDDSLDGAVVVPASFEALVEIDEQAAVTIYFRSSNQLNVTQRRLTDAIDAYDNEIVSQRIRRLELDENLFDAIDIVTEDVSSLKEVLGKTVGGFLPYMFILLGFTGAMYPGIDLGAGEKERGTLETILSSPASRLEIVLGKFGIVAAAGLGSALVSMVGLYLGVRSVGEIPPEILEVLWDVLSVKVILMIGTLLIPLAAFFAAMILAVSIHAKSYKEAQSSLTPLSFLVIVPVAMGLLPGIELNATTALVPVLNVSLATKEVIAGTIDPLLLGMTYVSLLALAALSLWFCVKWFNREETLFRT